MVMVITYFLSHTYILLYIHKVYRKYYIYKGEAHIHCKEYTYSYSFSCPLLL